MPQLTLTAHRVGIVSIPNSSANVAAGNFTGLNAAIGQANGTTNGRTRVKMLKIAFLGTTINQNWLRIYKYNSATSSFFILRHINIPQYTANLTTNLAPLILPINFPHNGTNDEILYSPDYKLAYQLEAIPGSPIQIEEVVADYA